MKRILAVGAICLALSACSGTPDAAVSPSVAVSGTGTPTPGVSDPAMDPLYLEAVEVYEAYLVEILKLERAGGAEELPPVFDDFLVGSYRDTIEELYRKAQGSGQRLAPEPDPKVVFRPLAGVQAGGSEIAIDVCVDGTKVDTLDADGDVLHQGSVINRQVFFARQADGRLRAIGGYGKGVAECPF